MHPFIFSRIRLTIKIKYLSRTDQSLYNYNNTNVTSKPFKLDLTGSYVKQPIWVLYDAQNPRFVS